MALAEQHHQMQHVPNLGALARHVVDGESHTAFGMSVSQSPPFARQITRESQHVIHGKQTRHKRIERRSQVLNVPARELSS